MSSISIEPYRLEMATEASLMLARAFESNPVHLAAFGDGVLAKNEAFFRTLLPLLNGPKFVATDGSRVLGLIHWCPSSQCQVSGAKKVRLLPTMMANLGGKAIYVVWIVLLRLELSGDALDTAITVFGPIPLAMAVLVLEQRHAGPVGWPQRIAPGFLPGAIAGVALRP